MKNDRITAISPFSDYLKKHIQLKKGMKKSIADAMGTSAANVTRWLNGQNLPEEDNAKKLVKTLKLSWDDVSYYYNLSYQNFLNLDKTNQSSMRHNENGESESSQADDARSGKLPIVTLPVVAVIPCGEPAPMTLADEIIVTTGEYHHLDRIYAYRAAGESMEPYLLEDDYAIVQKFRTPLVLAGGPLSKTVRKSVEKLVNRVVAASLDKKMNLRTLKWLRIINECLCLEAENADGAPDGYAGGYRMIRSDETLAIHGVMVGSHRPNGEEVEETW